MVVTLGLPLPLENPSAGVRAALTAFPHEWRGLPSKRTAQLRSRNEYAQNLGISPITFAQRGARLEARENSLAAFALALAAGVGGLESDVRLAADGTPVLAHDASFRRGMRRIRVGGTAADELAELDVPSLESLYETCGNDFELSLDLKVAEAAAATIAVARNASAADRLWLCSPDLGLLDAIHRSEPDIALVHSARKRELLAPVERHAADLQTRGIKAMNMHHTDWSAGLVSLFHRFGIGTFAWDVQEVRSLRAMLRIGIDGMYCDRPDRIVAVVEEFAADGD